MSDIQTGEFFSCKCPKRTFAFDSFKNSVNKKINCNSSSLFRSTNNQNVPNLLHINTSDAFSFGNTCAESVKTLYEELENTKKEQGIIGKTWDGFKNLTHVGAGSSKVEKAIKDFQNGKIDEKTVKDKLEKYKEGQKVCLDCFADMVSGIVAVGVFAMAVPTGGLSLPLGLALSTLMASGLKVGIKGIESKLNGREYNSGNLLYDALTGGVNGLFAPITNGLGSSLTKTIGCKLGLEISGDVIGTGTKSTLKNLILNQSIDVTGGKLWQRAAALGIGMSFDGALGGTTDSVTRATLEGEDAKGIIKSAFQGFFGGMFMAPVIGGGMRMAGKTGKNIGRKLFKNNTYNIDVQQSAKPKNADSVDVSCAVDETKTKKAVPAENDEAGKSDLSESKKTESAFKALNPEDVKQETDKLGIEPEDDICEFLAARSDELDVYGILSILKKLKNSGLDLNNDDYNSILYSLRNPENYKKYSVQNILSNLDERIKLAKHDAFSEDIRAIIPIQSDINAAKTIELTEKINPKLLQKAKEQLTGIVLYCNNDNYETQLAKIEILNKLNQKYINSDHSTFFAEILKPEADIKHLETSINYLNSLSDKNITNDYASFVLGNNISYSVHPTGYKKGKTARTKNELFNQLAALRNSDGTVKCSNTNIDTIINSENSIPDLSKIINELDKNNIDVSNSSLQKLLSQEGMFFDYINPCFDLINEINTNPRYNFLTDIPGFDRNACCQNIIYFGGVSFERSKNNLEILKKAFEMNNDGKMLKNPLFDAAIASDFSDIITNGQITPEQFDILSKYSVINKIRDILDFKTLLSVNIQEGINLENRMKLISDIENQFDLINGIGNINSLLEADLPNDAKIKPENLPFLRTRKDLFNDETLTGKVKLLTSERLLDDDTLDFIKELDKLSDKTPETNPFFQHPKLNFWGSGMKFALSDILSGEQIDFKQGVEILKEIEKENLYDILPRENIAANMQRLGSEKYSQLVLRAKIIKEYPELMSYMDNNRFICYNPESEFDEALTNEQFRANIKTIADFIKNNKNIWENLSKDKQQLLTKNVLHNPNNSSPLNNPGRIKNIKRILKRMKAGDKNDEQKWLTEVLLTEPDVNFRNIKKNLPYLKDMTDLDFDELYSWLNSEIDLSKVIKLARENPKSETTSIKFNNNDFYLKTGTDDKYKVITYDKKGKVKSEKVVTKITNEANQTIYKSKIKNEFGEYEITEQGALATSYPIKEIKKVFDKQGNLLYTENRRFSTIDGVLDSERIYPDGRTETLCKTIEHNGGTRINKSLTSLDGTGTKYIYNADKQGNYIQKYKITNKNGKVLLEDTKEFKINEDGSVISKHNGKQYKTIFGENQISIFDYQTNKTHRIDVEEFIPENRDILLNLLKSISGEELIATEKYVNKLALTDRLKSSIQQATGEMLIGPHPFIFEHELGHAKDNLIILNRNKTPQDVINGNIECGDIRFRICDNKNLRKIYFREKKLFEENFGNEQQGFIDYFLKSSIESGGSDGLTEIIAETNAILNNPFSQRMLVFRTQYLQQYFPKTIAKIAELLQE